jgi:ubiquinone/menaquinone biosynthesis C-methylase UbiE
MATKPTVAIITSDPNFLVVCEEELKERYRTVPYLLELSPGGNIRDSLRRIIREITGLADGNIQTQVVITDIIFRNKAQEPYFVGAGLIEGLPPTAGSCLSMLLGAGIPVIVNPNTKDFSQIWQVGASGAQPYVKGDLDELIKQQLSALKYNLHTLQVENDFATIYDKEELAGAATVSAIIWENEYILNYAGEHIHGASNRVKILDLGCGTGRFEEILLTNKAISTKIDSIIAVDFAPMYVLKAQERLPKYLGNAELKKIHFLRRVAEDLHWPDNYFDIVIAGFGITCFSQFHLTLPEMHRVLKPGGLAIMNGYNRSAITFDFEALMQERVGQHASHFAIRIDRSENKMHLGNQIIQCFTFNVDDLEVMLKLVGFKPIKNSASTFPTLYGSARKEYLKKLASDASERSTPRKTGRGSRNKDASYQRVNLVSDQFASGFNEILHMMDNDLAAVLKDKGFYFCMAMHK